MDYYFRAEVTDKADNIAHTAVQKITLDNVAPPPSALNLADIAYYDIATNNIVFHEQPADTQIQLVNRDGDGVITTVVNSTWAEMASFSNRVVEYQITQTDVAGNDETTTFWIGRSVGIRDETMISKINTFSENNSVGSPQDDIILFEDDVTFMSPFLTIDGSAGNDTLVLKNTDLNGRSLQINDSQGADTFVIDNYTLERSSGITINNPTATNIPDNEMHQDTIILRDVNPSEVVWHRLSDTGVGISLTNSLSHIAFNLSEINEVQFYYDNGGGYTTTTLTYDQILDNLSYTNMYN